MIPNDHQVTNQVIRVHTPGCVGNEKSLYPESVHHSHGKGHFFHGITLVIVETSLHGNDFFAPKGPDKQFSPVSLYRGNGEVWNCHIWDGVFYLY